MPKTEGPTTPNSTAEPHDRMTSSITTNTKRMPRTGEPATE